MTTGYNIRAGSLMLVEKMEEDSATFGVFTQLGECYAIRDSEIEAAHASDEGVLYLGEAARCGHALAEGWAKERLPLVIRKLTIGERLEALEDGTPVLDREP